MFENVKRAVIRATRRFAHLAAQPPATRPITRVRLGLDALLEAREVPATLVWTGGGSTTSYYDDPNWTVEVSGALTTTHREPQPGDDLVFRASSGGSNKWCTGMAYTYFAGGGSGGGGGPGPGGGVGGEVGPVRSIRLVQGYTGHLVFDLDQQVQTLELAAPGAIDQPYGLLGHTELTVTNSLTWTQGTLNSTANPSVTRITGGTATITPGAGNTLQTADLISFEGTVSAVISTGTLQFTTARSIVVTGSSDVSARNLTVTGGVPPLNPFNLPLVGGMSQTFKMYEVDSAAGLLVDGGTAHIEGGGRVQFTGTVPGFANPMEESDAAAVVTGGALVIENGTRLVTGRKQVMVLELVQNGVGDSLS
ncbi:MAG: hypothetical protein K2X87_24120 [Gemmataceae bacterium]|nr:hypothetical protein [Gemmataceae bacterium]